MEIENSLHEASDGSFGILPSCSTGAVTPASRGADPHQWTGWRGSVIRPVPSPTHKRS